MILRVEQVLVSAHKTGAIDVISIKGKVSNNRRRICMLRKNSCVCFGYFSCLITIKVNPKDPPE